MLTRARREAEFSDYVAARRAYLYRFAWLLCGDPHLAEDLVQQALTKLYVSWTRVQAAESPDAYARRVLVNTHLDEVRRPFRRREQPAEDHQLDGPTSDATPYEDLDDLGAALRSLAPRQRAVVVLRHYWGLSVDETADSLGIAPGTVKSQTSDAIARHLDPQGKHYPGKAAHFERSWSSDRTGRTAVSTTVPWAKVAHQATVGTKVTISAHEGPACGPPPEPAWHVPTCRTVVLGGVSVTKVTYTGGPGPTSPDYWRPNAKGAWVKVNVFSMDDGFLLDPTANPHVDPTPLPELDIDEDGIGPLLADPALDVTVVDG